MPLALSTRSAGVPVCAVHPLLFRAQYSACIQYCILYTVLCRQQDPASLTTWSQARQAYKRARFSLSSLGYSMLLLQDQAPEYRGTRQHVSWFCLTYESTEAQGSTDSQGSTAAQGSMLLVLSQAPDTEAQVSTEAPEYRSTRQRRVTRGNVVAAGYTRAQRHEAARCCCSCLLHQSTEAQGSILLLQPQAPKSRGAEFVIPVCVWTHHSGQKSMRLMAAPCCCELLQ